MAVDLSDVNAVIEKNMAAFDKTGVLSVRPGFKVTKDWLTNTKSIVVTVRHKVAHPPQGQMLPAEVGGVPVDVRQASPEKALELEDPQKYAAGLRLAPNRGRCRTSPTSRRWRAPIPRRPRRRTPSWRPSPNPSSRTAARPA